jgi:DNA mismatch repair protein MutS2
MLKSEIPNLSDSFGMKLVEASHPLLLIRQIQGESGEVVPLDMELDNRNRIMVITGPNTGGKTIAIKTAGLLCIMALSGIPVPASSTSLIPMVSSIFTDIGDEQAIESSLSTFSSHISRIASILEKSGKGSLVLLDELGTGTEPIQGAALACAILLKLQNHGSIVLATTHLTEIVGYVHKREGMINAAMEFDRKSLLPLYRLRSGEPGESHAIETARRYGIPGDVIEYAQELAGKIGSDFQSLLTELKVQRQDFENRTKELEDREILLHQKEVEIKAKAADMEQRRSSMMDEVLREKKELIQTARKELNLIIDEGRREKREAAALDKLRDKERDLDNTLRSRDKTGCLDPGTIRKGTKVRLNSIGCDAIVLKTDPQQGKVRVRAGSMEMEVAIEELSPPDSTKRSGQHVRATTSTTEPEPLREINLIGMHLEEAIARLEQFINQASISASGDVRIIHGIGTGTLRRGIREHLKRHPLVASYREGERYEGAGGATVAKLA